MNVAAILAAFGTLLTAVAAVVAAFHARKANKTSTSVDLHVNGNLERLLAILASAAITIPHDVATKVISAPPPNEPVDPTLSLDERLALEWMRKVKNDER